MERTGEPRRLVVVNYASHQSQCYVNLPWDDLGGRVWQLHDRLTAVVYDRNGDDLFNRGLYIDMPSLGIPYIRGGAVLRQPKAGAPDLSLQTAALCCGL